MKMTKEDLLKIEKPIKVKEYEDIEDFPSHQKIRNLFEVIL
jgi:hypothetical protein